MSWLFFQNRNWSLHNPLKAWTLHGLSAREVQLIRQTLTTAELNLTLVWNKKWKHWRRLSDPDLRELHPDEATQQPPQLPQLPPIHLKDEDITQVKNIHSEVLIRYNRRHQRFDSQVDAEIIQGQNFFSTQTRNVSESGLRFKDSLPQWLAGYFTVILKFDQKKIEITCALVEDQDHAKDRAEVVDTNDEESGYQDFISWVRSLDQSHHCVD